MATSSYIFSILSLLFSSLVQSIPVITRNELAPRAAELHTVYQYPLGTWIENIAVRKNGNLLVTFVRPNPDLHEINPFDLPPQTNDTTSTLVHRFSGHNGLLGVVEYQPDIFAVIADTSIYSVDLRDSAGPAVRTITTIPTAGLLNGMALLPQTHTLFISDSGLGLIWRLDALSGNYTVHFQDATMAPNSELGLLLGINGLRYLDGYIYYVNTPLRLFCRVQVDPVTGSVIGRVEVIVEGPSVDDFNVRKENGSPVAYLAELSNNIVTRVTMDGAIEVVAGGLNSTDVAGATSGAFGRTAADEDFFYVTTEGGSVAPVNGTYVEGGKIVALKLVD